MKKEFSRTLRVCAALAVCAGTAAFAAQPFGVNGDYDFIDLVKRVSWSPTSGSNPVATDNNGWPLQDVSITLFDDRHNMPWNGPDPDFQQPDVSGAYQISFNGIGTIVPSGGWISNASYNTETNTTTATLNVAPFNWIVSINITNTARSAAPGASAGFTNLRILKPGYSLTSQQIFTNETLRAYAPPFASIRFLGLDATNSYAAWADQAKTTLTVTQWADRVKVTDAYQGGLPQNNNGTHQSHGDAWEYMIMIANATNHDMWINVPVSADDDYVTNLAQLIKNGDQYTSGLKPNLNVYVEYSNEVWNSGFPQQQYNAAVASQENETEPQRYVERSIQVAKIFENVFNQSGGSGRIRPVVLWQYSNQLTIFDALQWWEQGNADKAGNYIYGVGQAPYYGPSDTSSLDQIFNTMWLNSDSLRRDFINWQAVAKYFGINEVGYEAGPSLSAGRWGGYPMDNFSHIGALATRDNRMIPSEEHHFLDNWFAVGANDVNFFALRGSPAPWGNWELVEDFGHLNTPKMQGARGVLAAPMPHLSAGQLLPWQPNSSVTIDASQRSHDPWIPDLAPNSALTLLYTSPYPFQLNNLYLLRANAVGTYNVQLYGQQNAGANIQIFVDDQLAGVAMLPTSGNAWSNNVTFTVSAGQHGLLILNNGTATATLPAGANQILITLVSGGGAGDVPSAPANLNAQVNNAQVALTWATTSSATSYQVVRGTTAMGPYTTLGSVATNSYTDTTVTNGFTYYYGVVAVNGVGQSKLSPVISATPVPPAAPGAPSVTVIGKTTTGDGFFGGGQVLLAWAPVANAAYYEVQRYGFYSWTPTSWDVLMNQTATTFGDANISAGGTVQYKVTAVNAFGSTDSNVVTVTVPAQQIPSTPTNLSAVAGYHEISLHWKPDTFLTPTWWPPQYNVYRATTSGGPYTLLAQQSTDNIIDTTVTPGTTYYYVVSANDGAGQSGNSNEVQGTAY